MILRKLEITNFRQIYGTNQIEFAPVGDRNVTVVLGTNGSGKTTLLSAFMWCLYGTVDLQNKDELISHRAVQDTPVGGTVEVSVTLIFDATGHTYHASRSVCMRRLDGGSLERLTEGKLELMIMGADGRSAMANEPATLVERLLPESLSRFFFFRGEDMEQLARQGSQEHLKKGTETFLDFTVIDRSIKHLGQVSDRIEREIRSIAKGDAKDLSERMGQLTEEIDDLEARHEHAASEVAALVAQGDMLDAELAASDEVRPLLEDKARLKQKLQDQEERARELRRQLAALVSSDGYLAFAGDTLDRPLMLAEQAVQKGELPAKIKPKFVDDLLDKGACICGRPIDDQASGALRVYRSHTGLAGLEEQIFTLRNGVNLLRDRRERFVDLLHSARTDYSVALTDIQRTADELSRIDSELKGRDFGLEAIRALQAKVRAKSNELVEARVLLERLEASTAERRERLKELEDERKKKLGESAQEQALTARKAAVVAAQRAVVRLRNDWAALVQRYLDMKLKQTWDRIAQLERLVEFTPDLHLVIKERGGDGDWIASAPSQANQRALALSFIGALIDLAREVAESPTAGVASVFAGGEYCLVMDAPFATMDTFFKTRIPRGLVSLVPQIIVINSNDQWEGEVASALEDRVGKRYVLELHKPGREGEDRTVQFGGRSVDYEVAERYSGTDWSIIREVA